MSTKIVPGVEVIDLEYLGQPEAIAAAVLETRDGLAVVDPGPTVSLPALRAGLATRGAGIADLRWILLTHIHLDHAGATGALVRENPHARVLVHERGVRHLVDPSRLLESATRIYGDELAYRFGDVPPVPADRIEALRGGEALDLGGAGDAAGRKLRVAYTPGHAWHHVSFLDELSGVAFVGDVAGERYPGRDFVIPVTPPPDIDLESWRASWDVIRGWKASSILLTHFGLFPDVEAHLDQLQRRTEAWAERVRLSLGNELTDAQRAKAFYTWAEEEARAQLPEPVALRYVRAAGVLDSWSGFARYWRKKEETGDPSPAA
jgi:glyoxylase-like metal-dependent hydrolase (beta-lactamase superfamily II)